MIPTSGAMAGIWVSRSISLFACVCTSFGRLAVSIHFDANFRNLALPDIAFTQFGLDGFHLFTQIEFPLTAVHFALNPALDLILKLQYIQLFRQDMVDLAQAFDPD